MGGKKATRSNLLSAQPLGRSFGTKSAVYGAETAAHVAGCVSVQLADSARTPGLLGRIHRVCSVSAALQAKRAVETLLKGKQLG